jgi:hypothetical protein
MEIFLANGGGAHTEAIYLFDVQPCEIKEIVHRENPDYGASFLLDYGATSEGGLAWWCRRQRRPTSKPRPIGRTKLVGRQAAGRRILANHLNVHAQ